ncbi:MAG TPA: hypothetical protein VF763_07855 [Candidatus Limnocylindrales bacterium]
MELTTIQLLFWVFLLGVVVMGYELGEALKAPVCPSCTHCQAIKEEERRRQAELRETFGHHYGARIDDEDRWRR